LGGRRNPLQEVGFARPKRLICTNPKRVWFGWGGYVGRTLFKEWKPSTISRSGKAGNFCLGWTKSKIKKKLKTDLTEEGRLKVDRPHHPCIREFSEHNLSKEPRPGGGLNKIRKGGLSFQGVK